MYIQCTKKLLDKLTLPHGKLTNPPSPQYCWHASFFEFQKVNYVVLVNDSTFLELFFPVHTFQGFDKQLLKAIEASMKERGAPDDEISSYLQDAGSLTFGPTSTRSYVARLHGNIQKIRTHFASMQSLRDMLEDDTVLGNLSGHWKEELTNLVESETDTRNVRGAWPTANLKTKTTTKKKVEAKPMDTPMVSINVELHLLGDTKVWRSFFLPLHIPFGTLHVILQIGFGWTDSHLHEFSLKQGSVRIAPNLGPMGLDLDEGVLDEDAVLLSNFIPKEHEIEYLYDYGDSWEHTIKVGEIKNIHGRPSVVCTGGYGSTPVEDCGGAPGYEDLCAILGDPMHEEYEEMVVWAGDGFAAGFDLDRINWEFKRKMKFVPYHVKKI